MARVALGQGGHANQFEKVHRVRFKISIPGDHEGDAAPIGLRNSRKHKPISPMGLAARGIILSDRDRSRRG
jgi:hypothetical protein